MDALTKYLAVAAGSARGGMLRYVLGATLLAHRRALPRRALLHQRHRLVPRGLLPGARDRAFATRRAPAARRRRLLHRRVHDLHHLHLRDAQTLRRTALPP